MDKLFYIEHGKKIQIWEGSTRQRLNLDKNKKFKKLLSQYCQLDDDALDALTTCDVRHSDWCLHWEYER